MYSLLGIWADTCPITIKLKDGTSLKIDGCIEAHNDCIELIEQTTHDIYVLQKEEISYVKILDSDIPQE
ncbi:TPA: hypothetical protein U3L57_000106 [Streptococcus agalactiae]|nr:hypothetical protein [Streptococcus agalactiae]